jgi:hypothetical protein
LLIRVVNDQVDLLPQVRGSLVRRQFDVIIGRRARRRADTLEQADACLVITVVKPTFPRRPAGDDAGQGASLNKFGDTIDVVDELIDTKLNEIRAPLGRLRGLRERTVE